MAARPLAIEFLYEPDCDSRDVSLARLREVIAEEAGAATIDVIRVDTDEDAVARRFTGSPTILINGIDPFDKLNERPSDITRAGANIENRPRLIKNKGSKKSKNLLRIRRAMAIFYAQKKTFRAR